MIADALVIYGREHATTVKDPVRIGYAIEALLPFWGNLPVGAVKGETCRRYARQRAKAPGTVRRELGTLAAALTHCVREGYLLSAPPVTLPQKPAAKERWLTRDEAARLLWAAWRSPKGKHIARFILTGLYTGTRKDAMLRLQFRPNTAGGWVNVEQGILYRRGTAERESKKRQTPARLPARLLAHMRRWEGSGTPYVVAYGSGRTGDVKTGFAAAAQRAGLPNVSPHTLKHTAITWALQNGASLWDAASYFGTSVETIERTYGHHSPDHQRSAREAMDRKR